MREPCFIWGMGTYIIVLSEARGYIVLSAAWWHIVLSEALWHIVLCEAWWHIVLSEAWWHIVLHIMFLWCQPGERRDMVVSLCLTLKLWCCVSMIALCSIHNAVSCWIAELTVLTTTLSFNYRFKALSLVEVALMAVFWVIFSHSKCQSHDRVKHRLMARHGHHRKTHTCRIVSH